MDFIFMAIAIYTHLYDFAITDLVFSYCLKTFFQVFPMINNILVNIFVHTTLSTFYLT